MSFSVRQLNCMLKICQLIFTTFRVLFLCLKTQIFTGSLKLVLLKDISQIQAHEAPAILNH